MKKILKLVCLIIIFGVLINSNSPIFVSGQERDTSGAINKEIKKLNSDIGDKKSQINKMQQKQKKYSEAIKKKQAEKASLNNQLAILDNKLAKSELDIEMVETEIDRIKLEIRKTDIEIEQKNKKIDKEKEHIANVLRLIYKQDNVTSLEIMLLNETLADFLSQVKYLEDVNENLEESLGVLKKLKQRLEKERSNLDAQNQDLANLKEELVEKKNKLASEQENKIYILGQVGQSEKEYQRLLAEAKKEQEQAAAEIASLEKLVRAKIAELQGKKLAFNDKGFIWPVPKNVITAYFHDPDYPFRYIFEHPGIDIRAAQGTTLKAAASGYIARAKDAGLGYSYIMIIHGDGLSTVYGHVSKIYIGEDEYVTQGQTIGLTGGLPGSPGAGRLTTGPHLHFEIRLDGIPVDPLGYMP